MPVPQLQNPQGAFGYPGGFLTTGAQPNIIGPYQGEVRVYRNASTVSVIPRGAAVNISTLSSMGGEVDMSTLIGNPLFVGIAITSAGLNTARTTVTTAAGLGAIGSDQCMVQITGVVYGALLTTGVVPGDRVWTASSTVAGASTNGGYLTSTNALSTAAGQSVIAGIALSSGTTGTTGYLTVTGPRGIVLLRPSFVNNSTL